MPSSTFQYWTGSSWTTETNLISFNVVDELYMPMSAEIFVGNFGSNTSNSREDVYSDYQRVRLIEGNTSEILFYGKIERINSDYDPTYGQVVKIQAKDNLNELAKRVVNTDYSGFTTRSSLISQIISDHSFSGNINTSDGTKFETSATEPANKINSRFLNAGKSALKAITDLAREEVTNGDFAWDFYLDTTFSGNTPVPDMHFFQRGTRPSGGPSSNGLTLRFQGTEGNQTRAIFPDFSFPRESREIKTRVRIEYVNENRIPQTKIVTIINHGAVTGTFTSGETIEWNAGADSAVVEYVDEQSNGYMTISGWSQTANLPGATITGQSSGASTTLNSATATPPGVPVEKYEQDIEVIIRGYDVERDEEANQRAADILRSSVDEIIRGRLKILRWPYYTILGTDTLVRTGHSVRIENLPAGTGISNQNAVVTRIAYDEGPGMQHSEINVLLHTNGRGGAEPSPLKNRIDKEEEASWQTPGQVGSIASGGAIIDRDLGLRIVGGNATTAFILFEDPINTVLARMWVDEGSDIFSIQTAIAHDISLTPGSGRAVMPGIGNSIDLGKTTATWRDIFVGGVNTNSINLLSGSVIQVNDHMSMQDTSEFRFTEVGGGNQYVGFRKPSADITSNRIWLLPAADGTAGQVLTIDTVDSPSSGYTTLQWAGAGGGSPISGSGTTNTLAKFTASTTIGDSILSESGGDLILAGNNVLTFDASFDALLNIQAGSSGTPNLLEIVGFNNSQAGIDGGDIRISTGTSNGGSTGDLIIRTGTSTAVTIDQSNVTFSRLLDANGNALTNFSTLTQTGNEASGGAIRLTNTSSIGWRNAANTNNFFIGLGSDDNFDITSNVELAGDLLPTTTALYDLGSSSLQWVRLDIRQINIYNSSGTQSGQIISGTSSDFDIAAFNGDPPFPLNLYGGNATGTNQDGGDIVLFPGNSSGTGSSGVVTFWDVQNNAAGLSIQDLSLSDIEIIKLSHASLKASLRISSADGASGNIAGGDIILLPGEGAGTGADGLVLVTSPISNSFIDMGNAGGDSSSFLRFRDTNVSHGMTSLTQDNAVGYLGTSIFSLDGGMQTHGFCELQATSLEFIAHVGSPNATTTSTSTGTIHLDGREKSGTSSTGLGAADNIVAIRTNGSTKFLFNSAGDAHADTAWNDNSFDQYDDWEMAGAITTLLGPNIRPHFANIAEKYRPIIEQYKLVIYNDDGHHFINFSKMPLFCLDAIFQTGQKVFQDHESRIKDLESQISTLCQELQTLKNQ